MTVGLLGGTSGLALGKGLSRGDIGLFGGIGLGDSGGSTDPTSALFAVPGTLGVWFDPSDLSTVFQDAAGTTPGAVGSVVGLMLDKSKGLALGAELFAASLPFTVFRDGGSSTPSPTLATVVAGKTYRITYTLSANTSTTLTSFRIAGSSANTIPANITFATAGGTGTYTTHVTAGINGALTAVGDAPGVNVTCSAISVREIAGNHASQATAASKPILRQNATTGALYLEFDGVDDFLATAAINLTATDEVTLFAGVRKLSDAATGMVAETGAGSTPGSFFLGAPPSAGATFGFRSIGSLTPSVALSPASYASPVSAVLTGQGKIATDLGLIRVNGVQVGTGVGDQGTGTFANYPLYIGRRAGTSLPFNGHLYGLTSISRLATAAEIAAQEAFMAPRVGVTI